MFVNRPKLYEVVQLVMDGLCFWPIWECSARLRVALDPLTERQLTTHEAHTWIAPMWLILVLFLFVSARLKLYVVPREINIWKVMAWAVDNTVAICAVTVLTTFFSLELGAGPSRIFVACTVPVTFLFFTATRAAALVIIAKVDSSSKLPRIALIGDEVNAKRLIKRLESQVGAAIRGVIVPEGSKLGLSNQFLPVLGTTTQVAELVNRERLDSVIMITGSLPETELQHCNKIFRRMGVPVSCALDLVSAPDALNFWPSNRQLQMSSVNGLRMIDLNSVRSVRLRDLVTRGIDIAVSFGALVLAGPFLLLLGLIVKWTSPGPVLERAPRVGLGGRYFTCLKFRTTYKDLNLPAPSPEQLSRADSEPDLLAQEPTPLGRTLRRYCLDELPQFINILRGEMSLVGPRPLPADDLGPDGMSREFFDWSETRARVHPGLTGLWQVTRRNDRSFDDMIALDLEYIRQRSFLLDLSIILRTPLAMFIGNGAGR